MIRSAFGNLGCRIEEWQLLPSANNFNLVRLLLASFVIWSHSLALIDGRRGHDEISDLVGRTLAYLAVDGFFFVSGFLVSQSLFRQHGIVRFAAMRVGRIWPGLTVSLFVTVIAFALCSANPFAYLVQEQTVQFLGKNLVQIQGQYDLPSPFAESQSIAVNESLWTITWELRCYIALGLFYLVSPNSRARALAIVTSSSLLACSLWAVAHELSPVFPDVSTGLIYNVAVWMRMWGCFATGIAAALWYRHIVISPWLSLPLWLVAIAEYQAFGTSLVAPLATFYSVLVLAFGQRSNNAISSDWHDLSYGTYIYAFPAMVLIDLYVPALPHLQLAAVNLAVTLVLAIISWLLIERPALAWTKRLLQSRSKSVAKADIANGRRTSS